MTVCYDCVVESEAHQLVGVCLEKAQLVRDQLSECGNNESLSQVRSCDPPNYHMTCNPYVQVSAEKLLYLEALDMCKAAVLDEKSGEANECIKRYRRAKLIFQHLLISASSPRDKALLHKCEWLHGCTCTWYATPYLRVLELAL